MKNDAWVQPRQAIDDGRDKSRCDDDRGADAHFSLGRIREELDVLHGLPQLVECNLATIEKRTPIDGRLDPFLAAIEETRADGALKIGDCLCDNRIRHGQLARGLRHASALYGGEKDMQIAQFDPAPDAVAPVHGSPQPNS